MHIVFPHSRLSGIYAITHTASSYAYIGSAVRIRERWQNHLGMLNSGKHHCRHLQRAWNKYGQDAFTFTVVEEVSDPALLIEREQAWIDATALRYNSAPVAGSTRGVTPSVETREKIGRASAGKTRPAISRALKGHRGWNKGMVVSEETRQKLSQAGKGRPHSEEHKRKIAQAHTGKKKPWASERNRRIAERQRWLKAKQSTQLPLFPS